MTDRLTLECYSNEVELKNEIHSPTLFDNRIWLSTDETAQYLGKTKNAIWILLSRGLLIKRKWRRRLYFKKSELDRLLETSLF